MSAKTENRERMAEALRRLREGPQTIFCDQCREARLADHSRPRVVACWHQPGAPVPPPFLVAPAWPHPLTVSERHAWSKRCVVVELTRAASVNGGGWWAHKTGRQPLFLTRRADAEAVCVQWALDAIADLDEG